MKLSNIIKSPKKALKEYQEKRRENEVALEYALKVESILLTLIKDVKPSESIKLFKDVEDKYRQMVFIRKNEDESEVKEMNKFLKL